MPRRTQTDLSALAALARDGGLDLSDVTLRVKADLLLAMPEPPADDLAAFAEMATTLIPQVESRTAVILARKLAGWPHAPRAVLAALLAHGGDVRAALIWHGLPLSGEECEMLAASGELPSRVALAARREITASAMMLLAGAAERPVDLALAGNAAVHLPRAALDLLLARARHDPGLAAALLARGEVPATEITPLFLQAGPERRSAMLDGLAAIEALAPSAMLQGPRPDAFEHWLGLADSDHAAAFAALAAHLGSGPALADALAADPSRDLAALALVAAGVSPESATRFLIRLGDDAARSVTRIFAIVALMRTIHPGVARRLVDQIAGTTPAARQAGRHQPAMAPSGTRAREAAVTQKTAGSPASRVLDQVLALGRNRPNARH